MSLLTSRFKTKVGTPVTGEPEPPKKAATPKEGETYVADKSETKNYGVNARRNMTPEMDAKMAKSNFIPEVDASGKRTGAYTILRNKKETPTPAPKEKPAPKPTGRPDRAYMQLDSNVKKTNQKQIATTRWDNDKKKWVMVES